MRTRGPPSPTTAHLSPSPCSVLTPASPSLRRGFSVSTVRPLKTALKFLNLVVVYLLVLVGAHFSLLPFRLCSSSSCLFFPYCPRSRTAAGAHSVGLGAFCVGGCFETGPCDGFSRPFPPFSPVSFPREPPLFPSKQGGGPFSGMAAVSRKGQFWPIQIGVRSLGVKVFSLPVCPLPKTSSLLLSSATWSRSLPGAVSVESSLQSSSLLARSSIPHRFGHFPSRCAISRNVFFLRRWWI